MAEMTHYTHKQIGKWPKWVNYNAKQIWKRPKWVI